jgi:hypothetical protein
MLQLCLVAACFGYKTGHVVCVVSEVCATDLSLGDMFAIQPLLVGLAMMVALLVDCVGINVS